MFKKRKPQEKELEFRVSGNHYHQDDLMKLAIPNRRPRKEGSVDRVYHYYFKSKTIHLAEDPKDPNLPEAVKVFVDDQWVGVVPGDISQEVREALRQGEIESLSCRIGGGPCTLYNAEGKVLNEENRMIYVEVKMKYVG